MARQVRKYETCTAGLPIRDVSYLLLTYTDVRLATVGEQPAGFPMPAAPDFALAFRSFSLVTSAIVIALIGFAESYAVAKSVEQQSDDGKGS